MKNSVQRYVDAEWRRVVGLMSGTSVDGVDAVLAEIEGQGRETRWRLVTHFHFPLPESLRTAILGVSSGESPGPDLESWPAAAQISLLDAWIAEAFSEAALGCIAQAGIDPISVDLIASHGQTVCHLPTAIRCSDHSLRTTLQLGRGAIIAERTGIPVVADFRFADLAAGGQGAPLVPYADWILFSDEHLFRCVQNLGGIGNVTYLPRTDLEGALAFDTGPANMLADAAIREASGGRQTYDLNGEMAARGQISRELLKKLMEHDYYGKQPPRSAGHEEFGAVYYRVVAAWARDLSLTTEDLVATLTALGPEAAVRAYRQFFPRFPDEVILGGGGSLNPVVAAHFRRLCPEARIRTHEEFGIPAQAKEALAFALLANQTMSGLAGNIPAATGAAGQRVLGCLYPAPL